VDKSPTLPDIPSLTDFETRGGLRASAKAMYNFLNAQRTKLQQLFSQLSSDLGFLYAETPFAGAPINQAIAVPGAIPGWPVVATYDQDLAGVIFSAYVAAPDSVVVVMNPTTAPVPDLAAGKIRLWVYPRRLS
jgi:hypothetical protein